MSLLDGNNKIILVANINKHVIDERLSRELKSIGMIDTYMKNSIYLDQHLMQQIVNQ